MVGAVVVVSCCAATFVAQNIAIAVRQVLGHIFHSLCIIRLAFYGLKKKWSEFDP